MYVRTYVLCMYVCMYVIYVCMHVRMYVCMLGMYACMYVCMHACMLRMHVCIMYFLISLYCTACSITRKQYYIPVYVLLYKTTIYIFGYLFTLISALFALF
jgi:hypothetical protein